MRMLLSPVRTSARIVPLAAAVVLMAALAGCASKKPLLDQSAASADPAAAPVVTDTSGVQTVKHRRFLGIFSPYRIDIQQGNFVSKEMLAQVKEGMTREQVRFALGTPLLTDLFHEDRWDYVFRLQKGNGEITTSRVSVFFNGNLLARVDGGNLPTENDYLDRLSGGAAEAKKSVKNVEIAPTVPSAPGPSKN
ncbi:outer membrane protein assembly factor BamE [Collimonas sp. OK412]|uniref:outer membrane protein assembly factor BamE n=1 Tax=Collimonas sp. (strain OK412) TaxID=1801619 RepID=UPI0008F2DFF4|nr:outer membrane protein assembly factor BamE [Collimonas sp. OK412]SFC53872.1 Beta-barrel assembly machine subunit BamE [Collimonas sp. OK412]